MLTIIITALGIICLVIAAGSWLYCWYAAYIGGLIEKEIDEMWEDDDEMV